MFNMPAGPKNEYDLGSSYNQVAPGLSGRPKDVGLNKSAQIGEILRDRNNQNRVVDNVMNFFKYKEPEKYGGSNQLKIQQNNRLNE